MAGKTITQFLVDGSPIGIKTIELSNWIGKAIQIPRAKLKEAKNRPEMSQPAIYFLFGQDEEGNDRAYIGEAENVINRLATHDTGKDFWDTVITFVSKDNNLTKADVKFLEAKAIERAKKSGRYILENAVEPIPNNLPEHQKDTMIEFLENIDLLISAIGFPIIKEIDTKIARKEESVYELHIKGADAKGIYTQEGFIILKGSIGLMRETKSFWGKAQSIKKILLTEGLIKQDGDIFIFQEDYLGSSPSFAASIIGGKSANGWIDWKTKDGKTLDEMERKNLQ